MCGMLFEYFIVGLHKKHTYLDTKFLTGGTTDEQVNSDHNIIRWKKSLNTLALILLKYIHVDVIAYKRTCSLT